MQRSVSMLLFLLCVVPAVAAEDRNNPTDPHAADDNGKPLYVGVAQATTYANELAELWQPLQLTPEHQKQWHQYFVDHFATYRLQDKIDITGWRDSFTQLDAKGQAIQLQQAQDLNAELGKHWPEWTRISPLQRYLIMQQLVIGNPLLLYQGRTRVADSTVQFSAHTIALPLRDEQAMVHRWAINQGSWLWLPSAATLAKWTAVEEADLSTSAVDDLALIGATHFTSLDLSHSELRDFTQLQQCTKLHTLALSGSTITDLSVLTSLPLKKLILRDTAVQDLSPLASLPLEYLDIRNTQVRSLAPLAGMKRLRYLDAEETAITTLQPLQSIPLRHLNIEGTAIRDLAPLKRLPLTFLNIDRCPVIDLSDLSRLTLTELRCTPKFAYSNLRVIDAMAPKRVAYQSLDQWRAWYNGTDEGMMASSGGGDDGFGLEGLE